MSGDTVFDNICHSVFIGKGGWADRFSQKTDIACERCGEPIYAYYCRDELYRVECKRCEIVALVNTCTPDDAAHKALGRREWECG